MRSAYHFLQFPIFAPKHRHPGGNALQTWSLRFRSPRETGTPVRHGSRPRRLSGAQPAAALSTASIPQAARRPRFPFRDSRANLPSRRGPSIWRSTARRRSAVVLRSNRRPGELGKLAVARRSHRARRDGDASSAAGHEHHAANVQYAGAGIPVAENVPLAAVPQPAQAGDAATTPAAAPVQAPSFSGEAGANFSNGTLAGYHLGTVRGLPRPLRRRDGDLALLPQRLHPGPDRGLAGHERKRRPALGDGYPASRIHGGQSAGGGGLRRVDRHRGRGARHDGQFVLQPAQRGPL